MTISTDSARPRRRGRACLTVVLLWIAVWTHVIACGAPEDRVDVVRGQTAAPDAPGPYLVVEHELPESNGRVYLPSSSSRELDPALFPLPLVVFVPGFSAQEADTRVTLRHLASHGFAVLGARHGFDFLSASLCTTQREGFEAVRRGIDTLELLARRPGHVLEGVVDPLRPFATMGHSYGGKVALWLAAEGEHVGAVVALDPVDGGDDRRPGYCSDDPNGFTKVASLLPQVSMPPVLIIDAGRSGSCAPADGNGAVLFNVLQRDVVRLHVPEADHTDFVDDAEDGDCSVCGLCPQGDEDATKVLRLVRAGSVAFLRHRLLGDASLGSWALPGRAWVDEGPALRRETR